VLASPGTNYSEYGLFPISDFNPELIWLTMLQGARTLTLYGAYKNYLPEDLPTKYHSWFEFDYIDDSDISKCARSGDLLSDNSTWVNDSGLTVFKLQASVTLGRDMTVPVRLYLGTPIYGTGYIYYDPKFEVT
jgi:hypothetical protein